MKLFQALRERFSRMFYKPPPLEQDKFTAFICHCMVCGLPTGATKDIRSTLVDPADFKDMGIDPESPKIRDGMCQRCSQAVQDGHTILINQSGTKSVILELAANEKLVPEARGKVITVPDYQFDQMQQTTNN